MVATVCHNNRSSGIGLMQDSSLGLAMLRSGTAGLDGTQSVSSEGRSSWSMSARIDSSSGVAVEGGCFDGTGKSSNTSCNWTLLL